MADNCAAEKVSASGRVISEPGIRLHAGLEMEILGVDVNGVRSYSGTGKDRVLVTVRKIPDVAQQAEVGVRYRVG